jgi:N-acetyl-alpha-D-muramate 1-phosphate uridylyltransferase
MVMHWLHLVLVDNPPQHPNGDFSIASMVQLSTNLGMPMLTFSGIGVYQPAVVLQVLYVVTPLKLAPLIRDAIGHQ